MLLMMRKPAAASLKQNSRAQSSLYSGITPIKKREKPKDRPLLILLCLQRRMKLNSKSKWVLLSLSQSAKKSKIIMFQMSKT